MAAPTITNRGDQEYTFRLTAAADTVTMDLPTPGGANLCWVIDAIYTFANGTITAYNLQVQDTAAAVQTKIGGQVGTPMFNLALVGPIVCKKGDTPKVVVTATGSTETWLTVSAHIANAS